VLFDSEIAEIIFRFFGDENLIRWRDLIKAAGDFVCWVTICGKFCGKP